MLLASLDPHILVQGLTQVDFQKQQQQQHWKHNQNLIMKEKIRQVQT